MRCASSQSRPFPLGPDRLDPIGEPGDVEDGNSSPFFAQDNWITLLVSDALSLTLGSPLRVQVRPEKLQYLKDRAREYFQDPVNEARLADLVRLLKNQKQKSGPSPIGRLRRP
jgi:hypothetical protein